jgi:hypothetical protein
LLLIAFLLHRRFFCTFIKPHAWSLAGSPGW